MDLADWCSLLGGLAELVGLGIAGVSALLGYRRASARVAVIKEAMERYEAQVAEGADQRTASAEMKKFREQRGVEPDVVWNDLLFIRTLITYAVSRAAFTSAAATIAFLATGVILGIAGNLLS